MQEKITTIYCLCDDFLRAWGHTDDPQARMTDAEVMTVALTAAACFGGNQERSRVFLKEHGYIKAMLSRSRLNRRLHAIPEAAWQGLFALLAEAHKRLNAGQEYAVDSMPVPVCDNIRIRRCRLYPRRRHGGAFRGYCASKRRYFYGLRVHLVITASGLPVEVMLAPASEADVAAFKSLALDLPPGARVWADAGYLDDSERALLRESADLDLVSQRRGNCRVQLLPCVRYLCKRGRERVETVFSQVAADFGRGIRAVTARGFELKAFLTVLAYSLLA